MKKILIIAGPNGAGKTTFAEEFLPHEAGCPEFVNADLIAAGLSPFRPDHVAFTAGRLMLNRLRALSSTGQNFAFETTLATRSYLRMIPAWQALGYRVKLYFLKLPDPEIAIARVARRVRLGGHDIPADTIRRRHERGWKNLQNDYRHIVDEWAIYDAASAPAHLLATGIRVPPHTTMEEAAPYQPTSTSPTTVQLSDDPDFQGAEAAFKRAAINAINRSRAAGLEPIIAAPGHASRPQTGTSTTPKRHC
ncbi:zeta toxin family protein [Opitutaceae bacterium LMO-CP1]|uniref:Zeta toxin family protein n=1 Tax=Synoicihabitans lomoniglobus TaxID=2909285 RepID=A0AAE9ZZB4_9BACT|nr:zeta toxin family protein [Opitutaceae bacterium LMO-M01]WED64123.1 zeta toxin family protein [Opitutaceae bacterium LMO-M01]